MCNVPKTDEPKAPKKFKHLSVKIRADIYRRARATAVMSDTQFRLFVERALAAAISANPQEPA